MAFKLFTQKRKHRKAAAADGTELLDLDVDRVDGVDRPATGRKFLITKDKDGITRLAEQAADAAVKALAKALPPTDDVREFDAEDLFRPAAFEDNVLGDVSAGTVLGMGEQFRLAERLESWAGRLPQPGSGADRTGERQDGDEGAP